MLSWHIHSLVVVIGFLLLLLGALVGKYRKPKQWFKAHKAVGMVGGLLSIVGLLYMTSVGLAWNIHSYLGILTSAIIVIIIVLGFVTVRAKKPDPQMRSIHLWLGRIMLLLMLITLLAGFWLVGIF